MNKPQEELRQVLATPFEFVRAASGHPITVKDLDGEEVCIRIPTPDEMTELIRVAHEHLANRGVEAPPFPSPGQIESMVRPLRE
jgi:DnaJ-class molecular chaperone